MKNKWNKEINDKLTEILQEAADKMAKVLISVDGLATNPNDSYPFQYFNNVLCVQGGALIENKIMTKSNYSRLARCQFTMLRRGCNSTPSLVSYESIPNRFKDKILEKFGDPYKLIKINI
jgi:hypothetical protein